MTREMKILQIERVVPRLINIRRLKDFLATLEFHRKHNGTHNNDRIDPRAESRNIELQVDGAAKPRQ